MGWLLTERRWGFVEDGVFIPVPKVPLERAELAPPCVVRVHDGLREIIEEPVADPVAGAE
jgi:hypothetical protein